jgi:hypothetical protein
LGFISILGCIYYMYNLMEVSPWASRPTTPADPGWTATWKGIAAFGIVLLAFAVLIWMIYEAVVHNNPHAYCNAKPFFTPFFIMAFSILGLFLGGWARTHWQVPEGLPCRSRP